MAYTPINNGDTGLAARSKINGIGAGLDTHSGKSGSDVHGLGDISNQSSSAVNMSNIVTVSGSVSASGYIMGKKSGVFAYITGSAITTVVSSGTYYPINGIFDNTPVEDFSFVSEPAIKYDGNLTQNFKIDWHTTFSSNHTGCTATFGIKKSGSLVLSSLMGTYLKTSNELVSLGGVLVVELSKEDTIQLVLTSDNDGDLIKIANYTTSINQFFN